MTTKPEYLIRDLRDRYAVISPPDRREIADGRDRAGRRSRGGGIPRLDRRRLDRHRARSMTRVGRTGPSCPGQLISRANVSDIDPSGRVS